LQTPKLPPTIKVTKYKKGSSIRIKTYEPVINNTKPKCLEVLTDDIKKDKSITKNQPQTNFEVNIQNELLSNIQLKPKPLPKIEIRDPEPPLVVKKLKEQLLEELYDSTSSEDIDDNISVGDNEDYEIYQTYNGSDVDVNDISNLSLKEPISYDEHTQLANEINEECEYL